MLADYFIPLDRHDLNARSQKTAFNLGFLYTALVLVADLSDNFEVALFPVAAARLWNNLPSHVTAAPSLSIFRCRLKSHI